MDENGSTTWSVLPFEIELNYYFNYLNLNLSETLYKLNEIAGKDGLQHSGWRKSFFMKITKPPEWITNFLGRVIFYTTKL